jgi:hypothetical protein
MDAAVGKRLRNVPSHVIGEDLQHCGHVALGESLICAADRVGAL